MRKEILILLSISFLTGCAERGYKISINKIQNTASAQYSVPITRKTNVESKKNQQMNNSVKAALDSKKNRLSITKKPSKIIIDLPDVDVYHQYQSSIQNIRFSRTNSVYQKFGNSELHGHVIYLTTNGKETRLNNTRIYMLPQNKEIKNWYTNSYLTNISSNNSLTFEYLNATSLNLNQNFAFYGIPEGEYFIIIVSTIGNDFNKKVYIAKKIHVDKRKKIMVVFSKKL